MAGERWRFDVLVAALIGLVAASAANGGASSGAAKEMNMRVIPINDHLLAFYDGRPPESAVPTGEHDWGDFGAMNVGVATYVIHRGDRALVYDSFPSRAQAQHVRDYLETSGIRHFVLVNSHWHLDHVGGNAVYADMDRIANERSRTILTAKKAAIESGTEWGMPVISPLAIPNIGISGDTSYDLDGIRIQLRPVNIHAEDSLLIYLPDDRILLAGDALEDTVTFIVEPEQIPVHYTNLGLLKQWDMARIYPNHGNPEVISSGGYLPSLIDATRDYLHKMVTRAHDPDYLNGSLESYVQESIAKGWVSLWWAYREAHTSNLAAVAKAFKDRPLPAFDDGHEDRPAQVTKGTH